MVQVKEYVPIRGTWKSGASAEEWGKKKKKDGLWLKGISCHPDFEIEPKIPYVWSVWDLQPPYVFPDNQLNWHRKAWSAFGHMGPAMVVYESWFCMMYTFSWLWLIQSDIFTYSCEEPFHVKFSEHVSGPFSTSKVSRRTIRNMKDYIPRQLIATITTFDYAIYHIHHFIRCISIW